MQTSIVIVSKDRKAELHKTLSIIECMIDFSNTEILVFLDGCTDGSELLKEEHSLVSWFGAKKSIGASAARRDLYQIAKGTILIGFDDDAHPLQVDFVEKTKTYFNENSNLAILAFEEVRGVFVNDKEALLNAKQQKMEYLTSDFVGCGFAIRKKYYDLTNGFPTWIDIYGEENCVAIEILDEGFDILYTNTIKVNHRVNKVKRIEAGRNYFRFQKQLKNESFYYIVYYPNPIKDLIRLYWHNFKTYAIKDGRFFKIYVATLIKVVYALPKILKFRKPVRKETVNKRIALI